MSSQFPPSSRGSRHRAGALSVQIWQWRQQAICCHSSSRALRTCLPLSRHKASHVYWLRVQWSLWSGAWGRPRPLVCVWHSLDVCTKEKLCLLQVVRYGRVYLVFQQSLSLALIISQTERWGARPVPLPVALMYIYVLINQAKCFTYRKHACSCWLIELQLPA